MKRALLISGANPTGVTVLTMDGEELEFLFAILKEARGSGAAPGSLSDRVFGCLQRALRDTRAKDRMDGDHG